MSQPLTRRTAACVRLVFVRNAQCERHVHQQSGDFERGTRDGYNLTEDGSAMAEAIAFALPGYLARLACDPDAVPRSTRVWIDPSHERHDLTATWLLNTSIGASPLRFEFTPERLQPCFLFDAYYDKEYITNMIMFTDSDTILRFLRNVLKSDVWCGPALCSTTIVDIVPDYTGTDKRPALRLFVHEIGSTGVLRDGGYHVREKLNMWNNAV